MSRELLSLDDGGQATLTVPPAPASQQVPGVILLPAIAGINDYIGRVADTLAGRGYAVAAIDYWARAGGPPDLSAPDKIMAAVGSLSDPEVIADVRASTAALVAEDRVDGNRLGVLGFCIGGSLAILSAAEIEGLACAVGFYGVLRYGATGSNKPESPLDAADRLAVPFLGHWGDCDHLVPTKDVEELRERTSGKQAEVYVYPGAGHAFHEDFRDVYRPVAAHEAWTRTERYLDWYLRAQPA